MRLDKLLSHTGYGTRKEVKKLISSGAIRVNDIICKKSGQIIKLNDDLVTVMGEPVVYQEYYYYILNKPAGIISATEDNFHETVINWLGPDYAHMELFPVGRLDIDTTGLLLLSNNGQLAHQLLSPKKKVPKRYVATIDGIVTQEDIEAFKAGLDLGDFIAQSAELIIHATDIEAVQSEIEVEIWEGKFHQVKRMFEKVGKEVLTLQRISMGPLWLDEDLAEGDWRELTEEEAQALEPYGFE
ncbi:pseudouridine synthase [Aerococcaceae bacterium DSM 109653]|uniref:Pseudouridine synthase n=1 Tax=Fundicoccus ignavus TaxID=2664442 RepID=A0A6I2GK81_9LACT|nr:pseudouridine synthase [Fundicoccus ignavus]MRI82525.1 pseudouridine synthase [Fundicoccus ignavus]MRI84988.1 pseudouridine synthase [Fundicoccus ignavus]